MKKITYQVTLNDDLYKEYISKLTSVVLFPEKGNVIFKVEEIVGDDSRAIIVDGVMYNSLKDYRKVQSIKRGGRMTELNPRAWSIDGECWCTRVDYDGYKKEWSGIVPVLAPDNRSKRIGEIEDTNIIVEFPIGVKDKNGKEIYEGDIVLVANHGRTPYVAIYREGDCCFVANNEFLKDYIHLFKGLNQCYEVIGNIHENPELLEEK